MHCSSRNMHLAFHAFCNNENIILNTFYISSLKLSCRVVGNTLWGFCFLFCFCASLNFHLLYQAPKRKEDWTHVEKLSVTSLHAICMIQHYLSFISCQGRNTKLWIGYAASVPPTHFLSLTWKYFYKMHNLADPFSVW